ncbi:MAG: hypothetical protein R3222_07345 [Balneolaceae bacterium]|nr:hypothetical protein [Balneolaceae bacterium]
MGELVPAIEIDGRKIGNGKMGPMTQRLRNLHRELTQNSGEPLPF